MERFSRTEPEPQYEEHWLNVDTRVIFNGRTPQGVWFRYRDDSGIIIEHTLPVDETFDCRGIYGGLMAWTGRYVRTDKGRELVAVKFGDEWHDLLCN